MIDRNLLKRATSNDLSPTPGYLYSEITRMTQSSHEDCNQAATYLLKRLQNRNGFVKLKVLNVIKHVCLKGENNFRRAVQPKIKNIQECLSFTGPPDPLRGDDIYVLVRGAAKEAIEAVYRDQSSGATASPAYESRIKGFGSTRVDQHSSTNVGHKEGLHAKFITSSTNEMVGIGNDGLDTDRKSWLKSASDSIRNTASTIETKVKNIRKSKGDIQDSYVGGVDGFGSTTTFNGCVSNRGPIPYWATNGQGGGTTFQLQQPKFGKELGKKENVAAWSSSANANSHHIAPSQSSLRADSSDEYLDIAVATVCAPGGTRAVPSKVQLDAFMVKTSSLDQLEVQDALLKLVENTKDDWRVQSKALSVLIFLIDGENRMKKKKVISGGDGGNNWSKIESYLVNISKHSNAPVREKCSELLQILGRNVPVSKENAQQEGSTAATASVPASGPLLTPDLLGDFEEITTPPQGSLDHHAEQPVDLFGNVMLKEPASVHAEQPTSLSTSSFPFMSLNPVIDAFQDTRTTATATPTATTPFSLSAPNTKSCSGLNYLDCSSSSANGNLIDLISDQPIYSSPKAAAASMTTTLDGLDPFHDKLATSSRDLSEIPTQIQTENLLTTTKSEVVGNTETVAPQSSSVLVNNAGMIQHSSVAMHQQHRVPYANNRNNTIQSAPSVAQQQQQMFMSMIEHQKNQHHSMAMQQQHKVQNKEMHKYRQKSFSSTPVVGVQNSTPIELDHDEFSFVRDAMKLQGK